MFKRKKCTKLKAGSRIALKNTEANICPGPDQPVLAKLCSDVIVPWGRRVFGARQKMFRNAQLNRKRDRPHDRKHPPLCCAFTVKLSIWDHRGGKQKYQCLIITILNQLGCWEETRRRSYNLYVQSLPASSGTLNPFIVQQHRQQPTTRVLTFPFLSHYCRSGAAPVLLWMTLNLRNPPLNGICTDFVTLATICKHPSSFHLSGVKPPHPLLNIT